MAEDMAGIKLRVTLRDDGLVEIWSSGVRTADEVAAILRRLADGFANEPKRVG